MTSFSARPIEIWRSSVAEAMNPISGGFVFDIFPSIMVLQSLSYLRELNGVSPPIGSGIINGCIAGMKYYSNNKDNMLIYLRNFENSEDLFSTKFDDLVEVVRQIGAHLDINLTFDRVTYLADVGVPLEKPLMVFERKPFSRAIGFEIEERATVANTLAEGDLLFNEKATAAQRHYSTGLDLLAAEDQIAGLIDAAFMQFYLAIECILDARDKTRAIKNVSKLFPSLDTADLQKIVGHVYLARHCFFGHGHPKQQAAHSDRETAFAITKQALVARWCARRLISLELDRELVIREMRFYGGLGGSIDFRGDVASLASEFSLPL